jgi:hypothetical protein
MKQPKYSLMPLLVTFLLFIIGLWSFPAARRTLVAVFDPPSSLASGSGLEGRASAGLENLCHQGVIPASRSI